MYLLRIDTEIFSVIQFHIIYALEIPQGQSTAFPVFGASAHADR